MMIKILERKTKRTLEESGNIAKQTDWKQFVKHRNKQPKQQMNAQ